MCGTLVWRGRLVPLALAAGLDVGFGIGLPRGGSGIGAMLRILPQGDVATAETLVNIAALAMFVAAVLCLVAVPSALKLRRWARDELGEAATTCPSVRKPGSTLGLGHDEARADAGAPRGWRSGAQQAGGDLRGRDHR